MNNISTNVTSVLRDHVSYREQAHSDRLVSFDMSIVVVHWRWYQVMVIGQQLCHLCSPGVRAYRQQKLRDRCSNFPVRD